MSRSMIYTLVCLLLTLTTRQCVGEHHGPGMSGIQQAMSHLEDMIDLMDLALQEMHIYKDEYSPWGECNVSCGIGYKERYKIGCVTGDCKEWMYCNPQPCPVEPKPKKVRFATCTVRPNEELGSSGTVRGLVTLRQEEHGSLTIHVNVSGFQPRTAGVDPNLLDHGFHVHEYGDLLGGCGAAGGHFNPKNARHGGRLASVRHIGDLGNIRQSMEGNVDTTINDDRASLFGENTILGRALVIHQDQDDLGLGGDEGSETTGNAGARLACCVIGVAREE